MHHAEDAAKTLLLNDNNNNADDDDGAKAITEALPSNRRRESIRLEIFNQPSVV